MTIGEANDLNTLLRWVLHGEQPERFVGDRDRGASADDAAAAAMRLADRSHKALSAGLTGSDVAQRWNRRARR